MTKDQKAVYKRLAAMPHGTGYAVTGSRAHDVKANIDDYAEVIALLDKYGAGFVRNLGLQWREEQDALPWHKRAATKYPDGMESPTWMDGPGDELVPREPD